VAVPVGPQPGVRARPGIGRQVKSPFYSLDIAPLGRGAGFGARRRVISKAGGFRWDKRGASVHRPQDRPRIRTGFTMPAIP